jgi:hypothetical protein
VRGVHFRLPAGDMIPAEAPILEFHAFALANSPLPVSPMRLKVGSVGLLPGERDDVGCKIGSVTP